MIHLYLPSAINVLCCLSQFDMLARIYKPETSRWAWIFFSHLLHKFWTQQQWNKIWIILVTTNLHIVILYSNNKTMFSAAENRKQSTRGYIWRYNLQAATALRAVTAWPFPKFSLGKSHIGLCHDANSSFVKWDVHANDMPAHQCTCIVS